MAMITKRHSEVLSDEILLLGLLGGQPDLTPVIFIGSVLSKALTPYLPKRGVQSTMS